MLLRHMAVRTRRIKSFEQYLLEIRNLQGCRGAAFYENFLNDFKNMAIVHFDKYKNK